MSSAKIVRGFSLFSLLLVLPAFGGEPKRGWTKLELQPAASVAAPAETPPPRDVLQAHGAELVSDYGAFAIAYAPEPALHGLARSLEARGWVVSRRDELDVLRLPGGDIDTREGLRGAPVSGMSSGSDASAGLFVIQLAGPPRPEWVAALEKMGWQLARYVPNNAYIAIGTGKLRAATKALAYVQWTEIYHPYQKNASLIRDGNMHPLVFDLPTGPAVDATIAAIRLEASGPVRMHITPRATLVYASMSHGRAERLLHQQLVIGVSTESGMRLADERQVTSLTDQLDSTGAHPTQASRTNYQTWLNARCPACATMLHTQWQVSVADTGFYSGNENSTHADMAGRVVNGYRTPESTDHSDTAKHGTIVAGIVAGNNALGYRDRLVVYPDDPAANDAPGNMGWFLGTGVAPRAGILVTKAFLSSFSAAITEENLQSWIQDTVIRDQGVVRSPLVTIQNHSFEALAGQGFYGNIAAAYDEIVRDANGTYAGHPEVLVTVAAGNNIAGDSSWDVSAGGMAKNVLTVSGVQNSRTYPTRSGCSSGGGFLNIMPASRIGTKIDGYFKPDVLAPASQIISLYSLAGQNIQGGSTVCPRYVRGYFDADSDDTSDLEYIAPREGTSFAAPVGAGAALLAKRHLVNTPQEMSPALTKAVLVAGARSIRGGQNLTANPAFGSTVTSVPSEMQGFGRLSLTDILTDPKPLLAEQNGALAFYGSGSVKTARFRVRNPAEPVKVALVWSDAPGNPNETNPNVPALVNDLDLEIQTSNGTVVYLGNRMNATETSIAHTAQGPFVRDHVNNVEYARFSLSQANEEFVVKIRATQISAGAIPGIRYGFIEEDGTEHLTTIAQDWALAAVNAEQVSPFTPVALPSMLALDPPANLQATASGSAVSITWSPVQDATRYLVQRKTGPGLWQDVLPYVSGTSTSDQPVSSSGVMLYRVIAVGPYGASQPSHVDVAFVGTFVDPVPTTIKADQIVEIRRAVNGLREAGGLSPVYTASDTNPNALVGQRVDASTWTTLMAELSNARVAAGVPSGWSFRAPVPATGVAIGRTHVEDLRLGLQ